VSEPVPITIESGPAQAANPSFEVLYAAHFGFVWRCLRGLGVAQGMLDDAAQEVFVVVHRRLPDFRGESALRSWLYGIVRNVASNQRRSERRRPLFASLDEQDEPSTGGPHETLEELEATRFVQHFLQLLGEKQREIFVLILLEGLSVPEAAEALAVPLNTAYSRLRAVRLAFQRALARRDPP
jgi:RNA polymerase sigma-70 factor (ECF subfamily)